MIKFYIPDGHLEKRTLDLFEKAGYDIQRADRAYSMKIDDPQIVLKRMRPQDFPFILMLGKGDLAITGSDIVEEFKSRYPKKANRIKELLDLKFGKTKLCAAVSMDVLPKVKSIKDFKAYADELKRKNKNVVVATEYPNITEDYLRKRGISAIINKPAGKTEAWVIPPTPEADLIIDTAETGRTLTENRCKIIDVVLDASARLIACSESLKDKAKAQKIQEIVQLFQGALNAQGKVNVFINVNNAKNLEPVLKVLKRYVKKPTISNLMGGGYDIFIVIDEKRLKYMLPEIKRVGGTDITISNTRMMIP